MIGKAWCYALDVLLGWSASVADDKKTAADLINRALSKRPATAMALVVKGDILRTGNPEQALLDYDAALDVDPNFPVAYGNKGIALILSGRARESFSPSQMALRLSPKDPAAAAWRFNICHAHLHLHEYQEAIEECRRSMNMNNLFWLTYIDLISAYGATGQSDQARQMIAE